MSPTLASVHAAKREPGQPEQGKGDRDADLVHGDLDGVARSGFRGAERASVLAYVSVGCSLDSVMVVTVTLNFVSFSCFSSLRGPMAKRIEGE